MRKHHECGDASVVSSSRRVPARCRRAHPRPLPLGFGMASQAPNAARFSLFFSLLLSSEKWQMLGTGAWLQLDGWFLVWLSALRARPPVWGHSIHAPLPDDEMEMLLYSRRDRDSDV